MLFRHCIVHRVTSLRGAICYGRRLVSIRADISGRNKRAATHFPLLCQSRVGRPGSATIWLPDIAGISVRGGSGAIWGAAASRLAIPYVVANRSAELQDCVFAAD